MKHKRKFTPQLPSAATVLILQDGSEPVRIPAQVTQCAGNQLTITASQDISVDAPVRIDVDGGIVLGEINRCTPEATGFVILVQMSQVIPSVTDLAKLVSAVLGQRAPVLPPVDAPAAKQDAPAADRKEEFAMAMSVRRGSR